MILPKLLKVGPHVYQVIKYEFEEEEATLGECNTASLEIRIDPRAPESVVYNTLLHEALHALYDLYACDVGDSEEQMVTSMANGLQMLFVDNPILKECL